MPVGRSKDSTPGGPVNPNNDEELKELEEEIGPWQEPRK